jgi:hypothetical protein
VRQELSQIGRGLADRADLTGAQKASILSDTARRFYAFK